MRALLASALIAIVLAGCGSTRVPMRESTRAYTASDYGGIYGRWTRSSDEFEFGRLSEIAHITATFEAWEFRWAYVVRYAADHSFSTEERTRLLEESLEDARVRHRFFFTIASPRWRETELQGRESDWRVLLVDPTGRQVEPVELTPIARPSADQRVYFPSISRQRHTYRVAFPAQHVDGTPTIPPDADHVLLRFASARGTVDLRWELERAAENVEGSEAAPSEEGATEHENDG
ncbi:hypothetical protein [Sandaracinus amylolyticus]|uniref:hypothetical protein n=1 Tax=Sandaracinus amylolyticus TaxID=927083 RepID=UPI001F3E2986|nr:hypothetical protein [Sandaracinus amylolyticus]UJR79285.1 Hypothetical protein I5071_13180 [Sandaracinus amylolyticus]